MQNGAVSVGIPQGVKSTFIPAWTKTVATTAVSPIMTERIPVRLPMHPTAIAVSTGLKPYRPSAIPWLSAPNNIDTPKVTADPAIAQNAALRLPTARAAINRMPAIHELTRNTCYMQFSKYTNREVMDLSISPPATFSPHTGTQATAAISRDAKRAIHVSDTKGNVSELIFHCAST